MPRRERGASLGDRAGLVEYDDPWRGQQLERIAALDQHAAMRGPPDRHRDRERRGQGERTRAGHDQQRDGVVERMRRRQL